MAVVIFVLEAIGLALSYLPVIGWLGRKILERDMDVQMVDHPVGSTKIDKFIQVGYDEGNRRLSVSTFFGLRLVNHRTDRIERVIGCSLELRYRRWLVRKRTLRTIPVRVGHDDRDWQEVELPKQSSPTTIPLKSIEWFEDAPPPPRRYKLVLVLDMVGPVRRVERTMEKFKYKGV